MEELFIEGKSKARPFLRWAGGKTWLLKYLTNTKKAPFNNYHEAFLGGGATFFYLEPKKRSFLSDLNSELIETYIAVKENVENVISKLSSFTNDEKCYYEVRGRSFEDIYERAARFIYLNQTSFNGIHRVNLQGKYNVPFGFRKKHFIDKDTLRAASSALSSTTLFAGDFYLTINNIESGDLVFLDPPYTVSHNSNGFIEYNEKIFSLHDQERLSTMIDDIKAKDAYYILTNAAHKTIEEIFDKGDKRLELPRANAIGGKKAERGQTSEYIFTNMNL